MRIRHGFVSNSSSSSFMIYGAELKMEESEVRKLEEKAEELGLKIEYGQECEHKYIGRSWDSIKDDETGAAFKANIKEAVEAVTGQKLECGTHEEAWYNG